MDNKRQTINSRIGQLVIAADKTIRFPRGIIGFENLREFALVEFKPGTPFHFLQSLEMPSMGMMLADPFSFLPRYEIRLAAAEERILRVRSIRDLVILVSVTVPKGDPQGSTLNLTGPICVNVQERLGLQSPQVELGFPSRILLRDLGEGDQRLANS
ncbi:MAG: flagellar assembly protein FliW [Desulfomicrobium sp.]|nr:flagellar assembly protein FliW [Pseudomonadota bacterium]MBV1714211.1 flagellar assembly protein FliW [Desulfomicrobium sp.]MBU4570950.1 flagellar assembly protein FliW [Pseudomonadota bacterium]MBU4594568.1 flagellar assembly protein FliW [Pseudomonadota bacterium]MBV1718407.1 flagellar assembly protein FliW [Desulfomicrobium sp.]